MCIRDSVHVVEREIVIGEIGDGSGARDARERVLGALPRQGSQVGVLFSVIDVGIVLVRLLVVVRGGVLVLAEALPAAARRAGGAGIERLVDFEMCIRDRRTAPFSPLTLLPFTAKSESKSWKRTFAY